MMLDKITTKKTILVVAIAVAVVSATGTAVALSMTSLGTEQIELFNSQTADTDFTVSSYDTKVKGTDRVDVDVELENTDTSASHTANVTVQVLNSTGDVVSQQSKTYSVSSSSKTSKTYSFKETDIAQKYEETVIIVEQTG